MYIIDSVEEYEDRGLIRTRITWHNELSKGVADNRCNITGQLLCEDYETCIKHCQEYGHYTREVDVKLQELAKFRCNVDRLVREQSVIDFDKWVQRETLYPQSSPRKSLK